MDWPRAIEINKAALTRIVAGLLALLAAQGGVARLEQTVYRQIALGLRKAETAVRRLIVVAARKLEVPPLPPPRPMPAGLQIHGKGQKDSRPLAFQLYDNRQHFSWNEPAETVGPRIRVTGESDPRTQFLSLFARPHEAGLASEAATVRLTRRLAAVERALGNLTREARRMLRWQARRMRMQNPKFTSPLRPGAPPGRNKNSRQEIDLVLRECHGLAWDVLSENSS